MASVLRASIDRHAATFGDGSLRDDTSSSEGADHHVDTLSENLEQRLSDICGSIADVEERCCLAELRARNAELESLEVKTRLSQAHSDLATLVPQLADARHQNDILEDQVASLQARLTRSHAASGDLAALSGLLDRERIEKARLQTALSTAQMERESALADLAGAYADMQAMQAALLDSALYVRFLRAKLVELQLSQHHSVTDGAVLNESVSGTFSFERTKEAIQSAIQEASALDKSECMKRVKQLRLRWHPDKNPELQEFASEVTKIINTEVETLGIST